MIWNTWCLDLKTERVYIMMERRLTALFKTEEEYEVLASFEGESLVGKTYTPLFPYFAGVSKEMCVLALSIYLKTGGCTIVLEVGNHCLYY
jgi:isoleucyl-tRNA synthetase